jgi:hypothetical protein
MSVSTPARRRGSGGGQEGVRRRSVRGQDGDRRRSGGSQEDVKSYFEVSGNTLKKWVVFTDIGCLRYATV